MSAVNGKVWVGGNWLEHLSTVQMGFGITPSWSTSTMNVCGFVSPLTRVIEIVSPFVTIIVGPGLVPFQPVPALPVNIIVRDIACAPGTKGCLGDGRKRASPRRTMTTANGNTPLAKDMTKLLHGSHVNKS